MVRNFLKNWKNDSNFGLVINWSFHVRNKWASAYSPYLVSETIKRFKPIIISSQTQYNFFRKRLRYILSFEPGWAAPRIKYDPKIDCIKAVIYSDPHYQPEIRQKYFNDNGFDFVLSLYHKPFFNHFINFPESKFVHFPWAVPDQFIATGDISVRSNEVIIFGGKNSDAYDVRNWCRQQTCVTNFDFSGVENKKLSDEEYFNWLKRFDAIVAAGSSKPIYNLVTPKYFEIASSGALLIGQYCEDLKELGFNDTNSLFFTQTDFIDKIEGYQKQPEQFMQIRRNGLALVQQRHKVSNRINLINRLFYGNELPDR
jgi:hypothetical protein